MSTKRLIFVRCMTLDVENCHAAVHSKKMNMSKLEYARSYGATIEESVKRATSWAAYYHTSQRSWYPKPDTAVSLSKVPLMCLYPLSTFLQMTVTSYASGPQHMVLQ